MWFLSVVTETLERAILSVDSQHDSYHINIYYTLLYYIYMRIHIWLVVWNNFCFFHILGIIIPTEELIFFRGVGIPPTSITIIWIWIMNDSIHKRHARGGSCPVYMNHFFVFRHQCEYVCLRIKPCCLLLSMVLSNYITHILHGAGIFTNIYPKNGPVL